VYRGSSKGPCIGSIYTHTSRVGGIEQLFPSLIVNHGQRSNHQAANVVQNSEDFTMHMYSEKGTGKEQI